MRRMTRHALLLILAFAAGAALAQSPARVASLEWMTGTWTQARGDETVAESWLGPRNGLMVATNLTTRGPQRRTFEFLRIADTTEGFSYYASPGGRAPVATGQRRALEGLRAPLRSHVESRESPARDVLQVRLPDPHPPR